MPNVFTSLLQENISADAPEDMKVMELNAHKSRNHVKIEISAIFMLRVYLIRVQQNIFAFVKLAIMETVMFAE